MCENIVPVVLSYFFVIPDRLEYASPWRGEKHVEESKAFDTVTGIAKPPAALPGAAAHCCLSAVKSGVLSNAVRGTFTDRSERMSA